LATQGGAKRRLTQGGYADIQATVTFPGNRSTGEDLLTKCTAAAGNCTAGTPAVVTGGVVQAGKLEEVPIPTVTLEQQPSPMGEPYMFLARYTVSGKPSAAALVIESTPKAAMRCTATQQGVGVTAFSCIPLQALASTLMTAYGPNPRDVNNRVESSVTVYNSSKWWIAA
jgi:hypothetical protein